MRGCHLIPLGSLTRAAFLCNVKISCICNNNYVYKLYILGLGAWWCMYCQYIYVPVAPRTFSWSYCQAAFAHPPLLQPWWLKDHLRVLLQSSMWTVVLFPVEPLSFVPVLEEPLTAVEPVSCAFSCLVCPVGWRVSSCWMDLSIKGSALKVHIY